MRMHHPELPYTAENGGVEVTDKQFELAWRPKGWLPLDEPAESDVVTESESEEDDIYG